MLPSAREVALEILVDVVRAWAERPAAAAVLWWLGFGFGVGAGLAVAALVEVIS